jgi:drug/metabolite transporter (DMT)-like permease
MLACASTFVVLKEGQENFDPFVFSSLRFVIAAAAFSPFLRRATRDERLVRAGLEIGVWAAGGYLTQSVGMVTADASRGAFLSAFTVVVVPVLAGIFGTATLKRMTWVSVGAALLGVMLLEDSGAPPSWGDFWNFASAVLFGVQIYRTEYWSKQCGSKHAVPMMAVALVMIAALSIISMLLTYPQQTLYLVQNPRGLDELLNSTILPWPAIIYMGVIVTDLGLWAEVIALQHVSSTEAAVVYTLEPAVGAMVAYFWLGERWGPNGWVGAVLIIASCLGVQLYGAEKD